MESAIKWTSNETVLGFGKDAIAFLDTKLFSKKSPCDKKMYEILIIEPFYGGSHKVLIDMLYKALEDEYSDSKICMVTMTAKKWHWRARTSALYLSQVIPKQHAFRVMFSSSVLNLGDLIALRNDLADVKKIVYFHENQLVYPVREKKDRDFQYGYNEIVTSMVADTVVFNSEFNRETFLKSIKAFFKVQPDFRPKGLEGEIRQKTRVLYFPVMYDVGSHSKDYESTLHIVWPHRWEHDKAPEDFMKVLRKLSEAHCDFTVSMVGEQFTDVSKAFKEAETSLFPHIRHWGFLPSRREYLDLLSRAHVAVSTAKHEFFGVAMMEAAFNKCLPLCPKRLVYPEIYPNECLYNDSEDLFTRLAAFSRNVSAIKEVVADVKLDFSKYSAVNLLPHYVSLFK
uniref:tRNA-queuosine alpha-mannosyltransferase n=1 Tax=Lygus hesperus TaxID=30085 RepID=A0A0A9XQP4_LYGHE